MLMNKGFLYAFLLAVQFGIQPLLFKRFVAPDVQKFSLIIVTELCKIAIAAVSFAAMSHQDLRKLWRGWRLTDSLCGVSPPAVLYAIQNVLVQASYEHKINSMMFNLLNQTKTLSAAFWIYVILGKGQSKLQVFALLLLLSSAVVINMEATDFSASTAAVEPGYQELEREGQPLAVFALQHMAVLCVLAASLISGLSAALTQRVLTSSRGTSSLLVSAELAVYGVLFLVIKEVFWDLGHLPPAAALGLLAEGFWGGWEAQTLLPVLSSALGGIVIGLVTQHAGSIVKGFALIFGLLVTGLAQWVLDGEELGSKDWLALALVSLSIYIHSSYPLQEKKREQGVHPQGERADTVEHTSRKNKVE